MQHIDEDINLEPGKPLSFDICNHHLFANYVYQIQNEAESGDEAECFIVIDGDNRIKLKGSPIVSSPYSVNFQSKMVLQALYKRIQNELLYSGNHEERVREAFAVFLDEIKALLLEINVDTSIEGDFDIQKLLKLFGVSIDYDVEESAYKNIGSFIDVVAQLLPRLPVFFINQKVYMTDEELAELYKDIERSNALVIFIEAFSRAVPSGGTNVKIDEEYDYYLVN